MWVVRCWRMAVSVFPVPMLTCRVQRLLVRCRYELVPAVTVVVLHINCENITFSLSLLLPPPPPPPPSLLAFCHSSVPFQFNVIICITSHLLHIIVMPTIFQALNKLQNLNQYESFSVFFHNFYPFISCLSVVLWLDKGDFPENVYTVCPC